MNRAGMGFDHDEVAVDLQREPFGVGDCFAIAIVCVLRKQQLRGVVDGLQTRGQSANLGVEGGQASGFLRFILDLGPQSLGNRTQRIQKTIGMVCNLAQRLQKRLWQPAAGCPHPGRPIAVFLRFKSLSVVLHDQSGQLLHLLA